MVKRGNFAEIFAHCENVIKPALRVLVLNEFSFTVLINHVRLVSILFLRLRYKL